jgi:hypothetical protein
LELTPALIPALLLGGQKAINFWYEELNENERARVYEFFNRTQEAELDIQKKFMARYNPKNQFRVSTLFEGNREEVETYLFNNQYWLSETVRVEEKYIIGVEKIKV